MPIDIHGEVKAIAEAKERRAKARGRAESNRERLSRVESELQSLEAQFEEIEATAILEPTPENTEAETVALAALQPLRDDAQRTARAQTILEREVDEMTREIDAHRNAIRKRVAHEGLDVVEERPRLDVTEVITALYPSLGEAIGYAQLRHVLATAAHRESPAPRVEIQRAAIAVSAAGMAKVPEGTIPEDLAGLAGLAGAVGINLPINMRGLEAPDEIREAFAD